MKKKVIMVAAVFPVSMMALSCFEKKLFVNNLHQGSLIKLKNGRFPFRISDSYKIKEEN